MGYYTTYSLTKIKGKSEDFDALNEDLRELGIDLDSDCNLKWYDHETNLKNLTKKYPDLVIELEGEKILEIIGKRGSKMAFASII